MDLKLRDRVVLVTRARQGLVAMVLGYLVFSAWFARGAYFLAFLLGLRLSEWVAHRRRPHPSRARRRTLPAVQRYCYPFFLLHGAVLVSFFNEPLFKSATLFVLVFFTSALLSVAVYAVAQRLQRLAVQRTVGVREKSLGTSPAI